MYIKSWDKRTFKRVNELSGHLPGIDLLMIQVSKKISYVFICVLLMLWLGHKQQKQTAKLALLSGTLSLILSFLLKLFFFKPRPFLKHRVGILIPSKVNSSFPSLHALLVFTVSTAILLRQRILGLWMWGLSLLTGFARVWVGHHYPSDIIGSALLGSFISLITEKFLRSRVESRR